MRIKTQTNGLGSGHLCWGHISRVRNCKKKKKSISWNIYTSPLFILGTEDKQIYIKVVGKLNIILFIQFFNLKTQVSSEFTLPDQKHDFWPFKVSMAKYTGCQELEVGGRTF